MTLKFRFRHVLLILILGIVGYAIYFFIQRHRMINLLIPEVKEITLIKADLHADTAFIEVNMIVKNRAPYQMSIDSIICNLSLGGTKIVSVSQYIGLRQESGESDSVKFSVNIPISHTRNKIMSLQNQDSTGIEIEAMIVYSGFMVPFAKSQKIEVPVPPRFRLVKTENLEVKLFKKRVTADFFLELINEGKNLSLDLHDLQYKMTIGNDFTMQGKYHDLSIRPQSSQILKFPANLKMTHPGKTMMKIVRDEDRLPFRVMISGYLDIGKMKRIPVVIFGSGKLEIVNEVKKKAKKKAKREKKREDRQDRREDRKDAREEKREDRRDK
ncbi:hypothetical protein [Fluviicola taffensis]|uniref:hypothetical protein n=1 Tax=Fluviicola taffensis TaxID=191579 RepID=UPI0031378A89